jgi:hypothetical protein
MGQNQVAAVSGKPVPTAKKQIIVISGSFNLERPAQPLQTQIIITQARLAHIQELQARATISHSTLSESLKTLRRELLAGAQVEDGPLTAWLQTSLRMVKKRKSTLREAVKVTHLLIR